jgi:hypothetical protein
LNYSTSSETTDSSDNSSDLTDLTDAPVVYAKKGSSNTNYDKVNELRFGPIGGSQTTVKAAVKSEPAKVVPLKNIGSVTTTKKSPTTTSTTKKNVKSG